ncbi:radical SAM protein [candidate division KSB1 bacterium]|nr:radical SAM protein [candidate division KSB1 bacterium]
MSDHKYNYLFGPVPSRRLGISLGVDLIPHKTCSLNCVYCECGRTTNLTIERREYFPGETILTELQTFLEPKPTLDFITFSGSGEPALHSDIGRIANFLKTHFPDYKIALLTNGTLFYQPGLIEEVKSIDLILPSLDAVSDRVFKKINRPFRELKNDKIIEGLAQLRRSFKGQLWLEVFIVPGLNDTDEEIAKLKDAVHRINPDRVQLNTLDRPGTVAWVKPATRVSLERIAQKLDHHTEIIATFRQRTQISSYQTDIESNILQTIKRRPCTVNDLSTTFGLHPNEINKYIEALLSRNVIRADVLERGTFFRTIQ